MTMQKNKLVSLLALLLMSAPLSAYTLEQAKRLPHVSVKEIILPAYWDAANSFEKDNKSFNRQLIGQGALWGAGAFTYAQHYIDDKDSALNPKNYGLYNKLMTHASKLHSGVRWGIAGAALIGAIGYTRWKFNAMVNLVHSFKDFEYEIVDNSLVVYYRMVYSYTVHTDSGSYDVYKRDKALGYMTIDEHKTQIEPLYQVHKNILKWVLAGLTYCAATAYMASLSLGGHAG